MPKLTKKLVDAFVCPPGKPQAFLWCSERRGFGVRVTPAGVKSFIVQGRVGTKERRETIGRYGVFTVDAAREQAEEILRGMRNGVDPRAEKQRKASLNITLREVMADYLANKRTKHGPLRPASKRDIERHVTVNLKDWADKPVASITREACLTKFTVMSRTAPGQANQCFVNLRALLNHAREMFATDDGEYPILAVNPVTRMFKLRKPNPEPPKDSRIPLDRIGRVWAMLQRRRTEMPKVDDRTAADWVSFMLLTGCRRTESGSLRWENVDFEEGVIHLSGDVVKNHNGIVLPMSTALRELLQARKALPPADEKALRRRKGNRPAREGSEYVFPSWGKLGYITNAQATMKAVSVEAGTRITIHDLRRTFEDVAAKCGVDSDQRRQLLNHLAADVHARHYANNRQALAGPVEAIAAWITGQGEIAAAQASGVNVVSMRVA